MSSDCPPFAESELLPISALQHWAYCPRQAMLIHLERQWADNRFTAEGDLLHAKTHAGGRSRRRRTEATRTLHVRSLRLGLTGQCDVVEFTAPQDQTDQPDGASDDDPLGDRDRARRRTADGYRTLAALPPEQRAAWRIEPVEYKRGRPKRGRAGASADCDRIQLAAQAMCLEEMLGVAIGRGWLWYGQTRRRTEVRLDDPLRGVVASTAAAFRAALTSERTPAAEYDQRKCGRCSLIDLCLPQLHERRQSARRWLNRMVAIDANAHPESEDD